MKIVVDGKIYEREEEEGSKVLTKENVLEEIEKELKGKRIDRALIETICYFLSYGETVSHSELLKIIEKIQTVLY